MGHTGLSITLANSIIGVGILAMPFCFQQCGVVLATLILILMGLVSRLCCHFLLKSAIITRRRNFEFLALHVFGPSGKMAVEMGIIGFLMGTCIAYFVVVGDLGPQIIAKLLNINQSDILRTSIMVIVSVVCVLPLGLLRNVDSLSNVSAATICFYFCLVIKVITEASSQLLTSDWHTRIEMWRPSGILQCVPIISMALFCQTQLFEIFESMPSLSLEKMNLVTKNAINICSAVYFTLGLFGYIAFGSKEISGNVLMSLSPTMASDVIMLGFVMSLAFSFPLIIFPCRASLYSFLYRKPHALHEGGVQRGMPARTHRALTAGIVAAALGGGLLLPGVELVLGLAGATIGVAVCVLFPAACFLRITFKDTNERVLAKVILVFGFIILVLGTYANLEAAENTRDKYDDKYITQERIDKMVEDFFEKREKDGVMENPNVVDNLPKIDINNVNGFIKDSEIQPPNPVPPESDEKKPLPVVPELKAKEEAMLKAALPEVIIAPIDKVSESHPRNLQNKLNARISNGAGMEKPQEKPKENEVKPPSSQEKMDMQNQQRLIETIKQHGEEQKELMQEQNKILDEIMKTKKELQQTKTKKEIDSNEAKKIAVESIQKIANLAIQSLGGVTEKPGNSLDKQQEPIQMIAKEAVQEIAKIAQAADAIQEMKNTNNVQEKAEIKSEKVKNLKIENNVVPNPPVQDKKEGQDNSQVNNVAPNLVPIPVQSAAQNIQSNDNVNQQNKLNNDVNFNLNSQVNAQANVQNAYQQGSILSNLNRQNVQPIINKPDERKIETPLEKVEAPLKHSHSPDEPQSYKRGEDAQINNQENKPLINGLAQNVPIPIAMRDSNNANMQSVQNANKQEMPNINLNNDNSINKLSNNLNGIQNGAVKDTPNNNLPINQQNSENLERQKREVDCEEKKPVNIENKEICEDADTPVMKKPENILKPNMNLNDIGLPDSLPVQQMAIHQMRSLKSYNDNEKGR